MPTANDRIGPYQLIRKLGEGGFGEVWLAREFSGSTPREVAVKMPLKSEIDLDALLQEATLWARATGHPNVLEFLAARVFDGQVVMVSEYAPDGSLKDWLIRHGGRAPSVEAAVEMTRGILAGLEHLHARGIIHRDIKPENVLLLGATPRLADFGVSRVLKSTSKSAITAGTPSYMAPEAFNRRRNQQTDLWSVGVALYQMLSGRLPFDGNDMAELYGAILNEEPEPLPTAPKWVQEVVAKALIKDPERRYQTAVEMRASLAPSGRQEEEIDQPSQIVNIQPEPKPLPKPEESPIEIVAPPQPRGLPERLIRGATEFLWAPQKAKRGIIAAALIVFIGWAVVYGINLVVDGSKKQESPIQPGSGGAVASNYGEAFAENLNGVKLEMLRVPGGSFLMGSPVSEEGHNEDEGPQRQVTVPDFYLGKYEVTQTQWKAVMGDNNNPSSFKGDELPVERVTWNDAKAFCEKLSGITNKTYRLPSEAEWEYACRAGTTGAYAGNLDAMAWYADNADYKTHPVGQKQANAFGLYDMHGNVWEWCEDIYHISYEGKHGNPPADGSAWLSGGVSNFRALRGGAWGNGSGLVRSATRSGSPIGEQYFKFGFRVAASTRIP